MSMALAGSCGPLAPAVAHCGGRRSPAPSATARPLAAPQLQPRRRNPSLAAASVPTDSAAAVADASSQQEHTQLVEGLMAFLREDLQHLFDEQGIDASKYEPDVVFEDPITYYNGIQGYLFNIAFLRRVFTPTFTLHDVRRTAPLEITTRWTMSMSLSFARNTPLRRVWDPTLTFTGTSIMGVNPDTGRFSRHSDTWDAVQHQRYFSLEAFRHMLQQVGDLRRGPQGAAAGQYQVLKKRRSYEVRSYSQLPRGAEHGGGGGGGVYAVADFTGEASERAAAEAERGLRADLAADGLQPGEGPRVVAAAGGEGGHPSPARCRNEVLLPLHDFQLW